MSEVGEVSEMAEVREASRVSDWACRRGQNFDNVGW